MLWIANFLRIRTAEESRQGFLRRFQRKYGDAHPKFLEVAHFSQAMDYASRSGKLLLVYLHSEEHDDTERFCKEVLANPQVCEVLDANCLIFAISVSQFEGHRLASWFKAGAYPFTAIVSKIDGQPVVGNRFDGFVGDQELVKAVHDAQEEFRNLNTALNSFSDEVSQSSDQPRMSSTREILEQQEKEYIEALMKDNEKLREEEIQKERLAQEKMARESREKELEELAKKEKEEQEKLAVIRREKAAKVPAEPENGNECIRIQFRLPDGKSIRRKFHTTDSLVHLSNFIESHELLDVDGNHIDDWEFMLSYPRKTFRKYESLTLIEAGIPDQTVIYVREYLSR